MNSLYIFTYGVLHAPCRRAVSMIRGVSSTAILDNIYETKNLDTKLVRLGLVREG